MTHSKNSLINIFRVQQIELDCFNSKTQRLKECIQAFIYSVNRVYDIEYAQLK